MRIKIASYSYSSEAYIAKTKLESEGIDVFLFNENSINSDPLLSQAIGGVVLGVSSQDVMKAKNILERISKYSLNDFGNHIVCPNCNKEKVIMITKVKPMMFLVSLFFSILPFKQKTKYYCENCDHEF